MVGRAHEVVDAEGILPMPSTEMHGGHNLPGNGDRRMQGKLGKLLHRVAYERYIATLNALPETGYPPGADDQCGGVKLR